MAVVMPSLIFFVMAIWHAATAFHAESALNYATSEAARAGSIANASLRSVQAASGT